MNLQPPTHPVPGNAGRPSSVASSARSGFTLIELLVSVALTLVVIGLINVIFNTTTKAVTRGIQLGDVIANQRTMTEQVSVDGDAMLGPLGSPLSTTSEPGMLAIVNYRVTRGSTPGNPQIAMTNAERIGEETLIDQLRSDQLMFLKTNGNAGVVQTLAPGSSLNRSFAGIGAHNASHSLLWYGHGNRANEDGTPADLLDNNNTTGLNRNPWQWVLARKELFLTDRPPTGGVAGLVFVDGVAADSPITGYGGTGLTEENWASLSDISNHALVADGADEGFFDALGTYGPGDTATSNDTQYRTAAFRRMFLNRAERVQINDAPRVPYDAWRIAQMHPYFMQGVSDFIVEFAGDYHDDVNNLTFPDDEPDVDYGIGGPGYDGLPDSKPVAGGSGDLVWYSVDNPPTIPTAFTNPADAYTSFIENNPATIAAAIGLAMPNDVAASTAFVWRHDAPASWPYLIRIRYRLHDGRGRLTTTQDTNVDQDLQRTNPVVTYDGQSTGQVEPTVGRWFEVVIPVNRTPS